MSDRVDSCDLLPSRAVLWAGAILVLVVFLPLALLSRYVHPSGDDYCLIFYATDLSCLELARHFYDHVHGRYSYAFLAGLFSSVFDMHQSSRVLPVLNLVGLVCAHALLLSALLHGVLRRLEIAVLALLLVALELAMAPSLPQFLYWLTSTCTYTIGSCLLLSIVAVLVWARRATGLRRAFLAVVSLLLTFVLGGQTENFGALLICGLTLMTGRDLLRRRLDWPLLATLALAGACLLMVLAAPGNANRAASFPQCHDPVLSAVFTTGASAMFLLDWFGGLLAPATLMFLWIAARVAPVAAAAGRRVPLLPPALAVSSILPISFFCIFWSIGNQYLPYRTVNVMLTIFIPAWFIFLLALACHRERVGRPLPSMPSVVPCLASMWLLLGMLVGKGVDMRHGEGLIQTADFQGIIRFVHVDSNIGGAWHDLLSGKAVAFDRHMLERYRLLRECREETCAVTPPPAVPRSIYLQDIDSPNGAAHSVGRYFNPRIKNLVPAPGTWPPIPQN